MDYSIFTDESGSWHSGEHYVRSWIKLTESESENLAKEVLYLKYKTGIKEIKYSNFLAQPEEFQKIFSCDFQIYITISAPDKINYESYRVIKTLEGLPVEAFSGAEDMQEMCKSKIISSAKNVLFLNYYERYHLDNAKSALVTSPEDRYCLHVDSPQFVKKEWTKIALQVFSPLLEENFQCNLHSNSKDVPGIEIADCIAGCLQGCLDEKEDAKSIFQSMIKSKMCDMHSRSSPNPNLIFYNELKTKHLPLLENLR
jgi:hypothetical protein